VLFEVIWYIFPFWHVWTKKNLATLLSLYIRTLVSNVAAKKYPGGGPKKSRWSKHGLTRNVSDKLEVKIQHKKAPSKITRWDESNHEQHLLDNLINFFLKVPLTCIASGGFKSRVVRWHIF
jgi:hypothetical protein